MVTSLNTTKAAREAGYEMAQYIAGRITALAAGTTVNVQIGTIPAGAIITHIISKVATAFTGGTPALGLGVASGGTTLQSTMAEAAGSEQVFPAAAIVMPLAAPTEVWATISGGATAGDAYIVVHFVKPVA